ncbi:MAG: mechanosensitive ion channel [Pirellulaceae bacterium]
MQNNADANVSPATEIKDEATAQQALDNVGGQGLGDLSEAAEGLTQGDFNAALPLILNYVVPVFSALLILIVAYFAARLVARAASAPVRKRVDETLGRFVAKLVFYTIMVFALLGVLGMFGVNVTSFAAVAAAAGFAVGLAFQGTLGNFAAGVLLLVFRPFKVGDVVTAAGITAKVYEIDLFVTVFDTFDNRRVIVPNTAIASGTIENISHHSERRVEVNVGVDYTASLDRTREVLTAAAESLRESLIDGEGRGYQIVLLDLGASSVNWTIRFWTKADDFASVKEQLTFAVKNRLDEAGIGIPFPQMDVHLHQTE